MADLYSSSHENIKRAYRKFDDLKFAINRFLSADPYSVRVQKEAALSHIIARREKDLPADISFDVVDIVLRLRAALDKAVVNFVASTGRGTSGIGFPFGGIDQNTGKPLPFPDPRTEDRMKKKLPSTHWEFILAQRPYPGGNDTLWTINEIANEDKHREDLVGVTPHLGHGFGFKGGPGGVTFDTLIYRPTEFQHLLSDEEREEVLLSVGEAVAQLNVDQRFSVSVVFGGGLPVAGKNVLTLLNQQIRMTEHIVRQWAKL